MKVVHSMSDLQTGMLYDTYSLVSDCFEEETVVGHFTCRSERSFFFNVGFSSE